MKSVTSNWLCYEFIAIGTLSCVARSGLVSSSSQMAGQDGVMPIALRTMMLGRCISGKLKDSVRIGGIGSFGELKL
jgi:hypothetical protein